MNVSPIFGDPIYDEKKLNRNYLIATDEDFICNGNLVDYDDNLKARLD